MLSKNIFIEDCAQINISDTVYELSRLIKAEKPCAEQKGLSKANIKKIIWEKYCDTTITIVSGQNRIRIPLNLVLSSTNFNGSRFYYSCPTCNAYVRKLYSPNIERDRFLCRNCYNLKYYLQSVSTSTSAKITAKYRSSRKKLDNYKYSLSLIGKRLSIKRRNTLEELISNTTRFQSQFVIHLRSTRM